MARPPAMRETAAPCACRNPCRPRCARYYRNHAAPEDARPMSRWSGPGLLLAQGLAVATAAGVVGWLVAMALRMREWL